MSEGVRLGRARNAGIQDWRSLLFMNHIHARLSVKVHVKVAFTLLLPWIRRHEDFYRFTRILCSCTLLPSYAKMPSLLPYPHPMTYSPQSASLTSTRHTRQPALRHCYCPLKEYVYVHGSTTVNTARILSPRRVHTCDEIREMAILPHPANSICRPWKGGWEGPNPALIGDPERDRPGD